MARRQAGSCTVSQAAALRCICWPHRVFGPRIQAVQQGLPPVLPDLRLPR